MSTGASAEARSEAELRVITVKTEAGDPVTFSGNPAELPGVRYETRKAMKRAGAFTLLIKHNASRLKNGVICTEDLDSIPIVTQVIVDHEVDNYTYERPCPATAVRMSRINEARVAAGEAAFPRVGSIITIPDKLLKLAIPNPHEVQVEALAYALTQLSVFEDKHHANELLEMCDYDGRKLAVLLDHIEAQATPEDINLVTGRRNRFKEAGLKGLPLSLTTFRAFFKKFDVLEYKCPPPDRLKDRDLMQVIGNLFIKDPEQRKTWSDNLSQPVIRDASGLRLSGPPVNYREAKTLAEKLLRGKSVIAEIDEGPAESTAFTCEQIKFDGLDEASKFEAASALLADPRKTITAGAASKPIDVPRGDDGKFLYWAPPMSLCDCGTPDEGRHIKFKWPCGYYRKPQEGAEPNANAAGGRGSGAGNPAGGGRGTGNKGKGKGQGKGKGKGGDKQWANISEGQIAAIAAAVKAASSDGGSMSDAVSLRSDVPTESAVSKTSGTDKSSTDKSDKSGSQLGMWASDDDDAELKRLMDETTLSADLAAFFAQGNVSDTLVLEKQVNSILKRYRGVPAKRSDALLVRALGS